MKPTKKKTKPTGRPAIRTDTVPLKVRIERPSLAFLKNYAKRRKTSLSQLVMEWADYLAKIEGASGPPEPVTPSPLVSQLAESSMQNGRKATN